MAIENRIYANDIPAHGIPLGTLTDENKFNSSGACHCTGSLATGLFQSRS
jgi:hypothetical protein